MIYTRQQVDYWRLDAHRLLYVYDNWVKHYGKTRIPGCTINVYEDSMDLHNDQLFLQVL